LVSISCVVLVAAVLARFLWVYPATYLPRLIPAVRRVDPAPRWQYPAVIAWAGMRGVVSLAAAFALPAGFPERELLVLLTFVVVVGTLLLQGTTLGPLIRRLRLSDDDSGRVPLAEAAAHHEATGAALEWLTATAAERAGDPVRTAVAHALRDDAERHRLDAWERLGSDPHGTPSGVYRRLRLDMLGVERRTVLEMRDDGRIDDEVLRRVQRDLDIVEAALTRD
jgi:CPA1 family monovalent cation:H+ antiporter